MIKFGLILLALRFLEWSLEQLSEWSYLRLLYARGRREDP